MTATATATQQKQTLKKKKKRISKHMQVPPPAPAVIPDELQGVDMPTPTPATKKKPKKPKRKTKDPIQVAQYLSEWKHRASVTNWKFNKNTQSWIVRHMYEADKLNKPAFDICLEYLGAVGDGAKLRVVEDAKHRVRRYKQYEGNMKISSSGTNDEQIAADQDDKTRWNALDDHSKRKEYKRARKVLETLQQPLQEEK